MQELVPSSTSPVGDDPLPQGGRLRWVNDRDERFQELIAKGYLIVEKDGKQVTRSAGRSTGGTQYLMQAPPMLAYEATPDYEAVTYNDVIDVVAENIVVRIVIPSSPALRQRLINWLDKHKRGKQVRERILRLNPTIGEGARIRGWHPHGSLKGNYDMWNLMGKKEFIRKYGREALSKVPKYCFKRFGKRAYIYAEAVEDRIWERP